LHPKACPTPFLQFGHNWDSFFEAFVVGVLHLRAIRSYAPPKSFFSNPFNLWQKDDGTYKVKVEIHFFSLLAL
jgi:hypothetical protein